MEVKMNKEIRDYQESMFWGLSFRQCLFSVLAILAALGIYFLTRKYAGEQVTGWLCVLGAAPFAACGFFRYHGMTAEQFAWAVIKSELLYPKRLVFKSENLYFSCMEESLRLGEKMMGNGAELLEKKRTKQKKPKKPGGRGDALIKTLSQTLKQDKEKFKVPRSVQQATRSARSGRTEFFRWRASIPGHSGLRISTIPLPAKRIRQRCSWTTPNF